MTYRTLTTARGLAKLAKAHADGSSLKLTHVVFGDGKGTEYEPQASQTKLKNQVHKAPLLSLRQDETNPSWLIAEAVVDKDAGPFWLREAGVLDEEGDLIIIVSMPPAYKPSPKNHPGVVSDLLLELVVEFVNADKVTLTVDPSAVLATRRYVDEAVSEASKLIKNLVGGAPEALDSFAELAKALANNPHFARDITASLDALKKQLSGHYTKAQVDKLIKGLSDQMAKLDVYSKAQVDQKLKDALAKQTAPTFSGTPLIQSAAPTLEWRDIDHKTGGRSFWWHANGGRFYLLMDRDGKGGWDGPHPLWVDPDGSVNITKLKVAGKEVVLKGDDTGAVPTGSVLPFAGAARPQGFLFCDGAAISRTAYAKLFAAIGTSYGAGNGKTTFNIPDSRGRFWRHGGSGVARGERKESSIKSHNHLVDPPNAITNTTGNHRHKYTDRYMRYAERSYDSKTEDAHIRLTSGSYYTDYAGNHNHHVNIPAFWSAATGGADTYPRYVAGSLAIIKY